MANEDLAFRKMKLKDFERFFEVKGRQARRLKARMKKRLGLKEDDHILFPLFCTAVNKPQEVVRAFYGW